MSLSKSEYLESLQQKLHVHLPNEERQIQEEIGKFEARLLDIENEKRIVQAEIDFHLKAGKRTPKTSKGILDIPTVIWSGIGTYLQGYEFVLHNACLSSVDIEEAVTGDSKKKKLRLIGEKVVTVLLMNYYLSGDDLWKILETNSPDLQRFAGANWWCLHARMSDGNFSGFLEKVTFNQADDISLFKDKALQASNKWLLFKGQEFAFDTTEISTAAEDELFWEAAVSFLQTFGPYLLCIIVELNDEFPINDRIQNFCTDLLRVIPKVRHINWSRGDTDDGDLTYVITKTNNRTVEPYFSIEMEIEPLQKMAWFESLRQNCVSWQIYSERLEDVQQPQPGFWDGAKEISLYIDPDESSTMSETFTNILHADFSNLQNNKKIVFDGQSYEWTCLSLLTKFPNVTEVALLDKTCKFGIPNDLNINIEEYSFLKVTKLTFNVTGSMPPPMDILPTVLPSLRQLCLKHKLGFIFVEPGLKQLHQHGKFNDHNIDIYRLIAEETSLKESNIWNEMGNLRIISIKRVVLDTGLSDRLTETEWPFKFGRSEIYTRSDDGSIRFEIIFTAE